MNCMMTVNEFCQEHALSRAMFYKLLREGRGPKAVKLGRKTLVSGEAAQEWRRQLEREVPVAAQEPPR